MKRWWHLAMLALAALPMLCAAPANAMDVRPCEDPAVFRDTPVNLLILPYTDAVEARRPVSGAARALTVLMQQDSLIEMAKYEGIGIVNLVQFPGAPPCDPDAVWQRMSSGQGSQGVAPGRGIAMLWGRIYEEQGQLYIQSFVRFARAGREETIETSVPAADGALRFRAHLPRQALAFAAQRISYDDLKRVRSAFAESARVYEQPDPYAKVLQLAPDPDAFQPFGYTVSEVRGDWMHVRPLYGGPAGWVKARVDAQRWPLRERMPELHFVDAVVGYLEIRARGDKAPPRFARYAQQSLALYAKGSDGAAPSSAVAATAAALQGALAWLDGQGGAADEGFAAAARLLPYSGDAQNLRNVARIAAQAPRLEDPARAKALMGDLLEAVSAEPDNADAIANLRSFHRLLQARPAAAQAIGAAELARQQAVLGGLR